MTDADILNLFDGPSIWDDRKRALAAEMGYKAAEKKLMKEWPYDDEEGLAMALSVVRAKVGY